MPRRSPPLKITYKVKLVEGRYLAKVQGKAMLDLLRWIRDHEEELGKDESRAVP